MIMGFSYKVVG